MIEHKSYIRFIIIAFCFTCNTPWMNLDSNEQFFFFQLSQGNQNEVIVGGNKIESSEFETAQSSFDLKRYSLSEELYWWYYTRLIHDPISALKIKDDQHKTWLTLNRFQKSLVAMNMLIARGNNGGTFSLFTEFPEYYFAAAEALALLNLAELKTEFDVPLSYVRKRYGDLEKLDNLFKNDSKSFYDNHESFLEKHDN